MTVLRPDNNMAYVEFAYSLPVIAAKADMNASLEKNVDSPVVRDFGEEWSAFRQDEKSLARDQRETIFENYFHIFPWHLLPPNSGIGVDFGCGTGRWAMMVAPRVAHLHLLDISPEALAVAHVSFYVSSVADIPLPARSLDFAFSLGVLHHVPDTQAAIEAIAQKLKDGAPFLVYLYYAFDNRPAWYRPLWMLSNGVRLIVSRFPHRMRVVITGTIAAAVYWPFARLAALLSRFGVSRQTLPLSWYADKSFYVMRTDSYDRLCTRLEKRFIRVQIEQILVRTGFEQILSDLAPYWCSVGNRSQYGLSV